jgi:hypothetical protein
MDRVLNSRPARGTGPLLRDREADRFRQAAVDLDLERLRYWGPLRHPAGPRSSTRCTRRGPDVKPVPCPTCGRTVKPVRGAYGLTDAEGMRAAEEGRIVLGGCDPTFGPEFVCPECGGPVASRVASRWTPDTEEPAPRGRS